ncbi:MAG: PAS domain S-box protein [Promethearchaeota archaeon]
MEDKNRFNQMVSILLIEDNTSDIRIIKELLKEAREFIFDLRIAENFAKGLNCIEEASFDIILLDLMLPDSSGIETLERILDEISISPIIVLTGMDNMNLAIKAVKAGAQDYLVKDQIESNSLIRSIFHAIDRHKMKQTIESLVYKLQKDELRLRKIIEENADSIIIVDKKGIVRFVNSIAEKFFERDINEFIGEKFGYATEPENQEITVLRLSGKRAIAEVNSVEIDWEGEIADLLTIRDVTEHRMYELRLQESEKRYRDLFEKSPYPILILNRSGVVVDCNSSLEHILELNRKDLVNRYYADTPLVIPEYLELFDKIHSEILRGNFPNPIEIKYLKTIKNEIIWLKLNFSSINIGNQALIYVLIQDITVIKQSEQEVKRLEQILHEMNALIEDAPLAILLVHIKGKILRANQKALNLFQIQIQDVLNLEIFDLFSSKNIEIIKKHYTEDIHIFSGPTKIEITIQRKEGNPVDVEITSTLIKIADNIIIQSFFSDITGRKIYERNLQELLDKLITSLDFKSKFLATMSHELRTPLNAIIGFTSLLLDGSYGQLNKDQKEFLEDVTSEADHLKRLIDTILDFSLIDMGKFELNVENFKLLPIYHEIVSIVNHLFKKKGLNINFEGINEKIHIKADPLRFKQILYNLFDNAIKFTEQGHITFRCIVREDSWEFQVEDTGIGIAEDDYDVVFREFGRIKNSKSRTVSGSGIGLALTKRLVELHNGEIWFESEVGKGTTFSFTLPK